MTSNRSLRTALVTVLASALGVAAPLASATAAGDSPLAGKILATKSHYSGTQRVMLMNPDGSGLRALFHGMDPAWSPDADSIAYWYPTEWGVDDTPRLYVWDAASKESTFVTEGRSPDWSPDGNELAYATGSGHSTPGEIYAIEPTTTGTPRNLSNDPSNYDAQPAWSPDGAQIAFVKDLDSNLYGPRLYVMNSDGSEQSLIVDGLFAADPAWSPSGRRIAFRGSKPNWHDTEIFTVRPDGSGLRQVTENKDSESSPAWTSDGLGLLYASTSSRFPVAPLYLLRLGEQDRRRIGCRASPDDFDWGSPDQAAGHIDVAALGKRRAPTHLDAYRDRNYVTTQIFAPKGPCEPPDEDCVGGRTLLLKKRRPGRDRLLNKQRTTQRGLSYLDTRGERGGMYTVIRGESFTSPEGRKVICEPARADVREPR